MKFKNYLNESFSLEDEIKSFENTLRTFERTGKGISRDKASFERMITNLCKKYPSTFDKKLWKGSLSGLGNELDDDYIIDFYRQIIFDLKKANINESGFDPAYCQVMVNFTKDCYEETGKYPFDIDRSELHKTKAYKKMQDECDKIRNKD
jgi:hypothetical protein